MASRTAKRPDSGSGQPIATDRVGARTPFEARLQELLERVAEGVGSADEAAVALRDLPFADLGFAKVDHHRELRQGACEIVLARGKTPEEVRAIVERLLLCNE